MKQGDPKPERFIDRILREETEKAEKVIDLSDVNPENIARWSDPKNLERRETEVLEGLELFYSVDDNALEGREVTFVRMTGPFEELPHRHNNANAFLIFTNGEGIVMQEIHGEGREMRRGVGHRTLVPKGTVHGFRLKQGEILELLSIQDPPIKDPKTGKQDYEIIPNFKIRSKK